MRIVEWFKRRWNSGEISEGSQAVSATDQPLLSDSPAFPNESPKRGRPAVEVDRARAEAMLRAGMPQAEVARRLGIKAPTLFNRIKEWAANPLPPVEPDPPRASVAPVAVRLPTAQSGTSEPPAALPPAFQDAISGLKKPAPKPAEVPTVVAEMPIVEAPEPVYPEVPYLFLVANEKDCVTAAAYGLFSVAWTDSQAPARMRASRRVYLVTRTDEERQTILAALQQNPVRARVRVCVGDLEPLCMIAKRTFIEGNGQQPEVFEVFSGCAIAPQRVLVPHCGVPRGL